MTAAETSLQLDSLQEEVNSAHIYRALADNEKNPDIAKVYRNLAEVEEKHADFWREQLRQAGEPVPSLRPDWRTRVLIGIARRLGPQWVLPSLVSGEAERTQFYSHQPAAKEAGLAAEERSHQRLLSELARTTTSGAEGGTIARLEGRHRAVGGNALRAAVLGANDGLVSNLSLVMGVAGAELAAQNILITGMAGLLAGAFSMALGEWLSVQSSRELYQHQIDIEARELAANPEEEAEELALIYQAKGVPRDRAEQLASQIISDEDQALDTLAREELGIDPEELGGSAWEAAFTSFFLFAAGAILPVLPYFGMEGMPAVGVSVALSTFGLFAIGALITVMTGRSVWLSGGRQVLFGLAAAAITYGIGYLLGVSVAG